MNLKQTYKDHAHFSYTLHPQGPQPLTLYQPPQATQSVGPKELHVDITACVLPHTCSLCFTSSPGTDLRQ